MDEYQADQIIKLASIPYDRGYEKPPIPNAAKANEKKRRTAWKFW